MANNYLPKFRPGQTVTFNVSTAVVAGSLVKVGSADRSVAPATAGDVSIGLAGHDAAIGDKVTVELGKTVHIVTASGAVARGQRVEAAGGKTVRTHNTGVVFGVALTSAADGQPVEVVQL